MKLNSEKIYKELNRLDKTIVWLSQEVGTSKQLVSYWLQKKSLSGVDRIAKVFDMDPKDLVK